MVGRSKTSCASFCFDPTEKPSPSDRVGKHSFLLHEEEEEVMGVPLWSTVKTKKERKGRNKGGRGGEKNG